MATKYTYTPLDSASQSIRLVELQPGDGDTIEFKTHTVRLSDHPSYTAVSYTWGDPGAEIPILLDGKEFLIRENLGAFLDTMRSSSRFCRFWIDAICIDQSNAPERDAQISIMRRIFAQAAQVFVWLGPASDDTELAAECITTRCISPSRLQAHLVSALRDVLGRQYWRRVWIVQELMLADYAVFFCGESSFTWKDTLSFYKWLKDIRFQPQVSGSPGWQVIWKKFVWDSLPADDKSYSLGTLLEMYQGQECTDKRDHVYGLLGLAQRSRLEIDSSISLQDLYVNVLQAVVDEDKFGEPQSFAKMEGILMRMFHLHRDSWASPWQLDAGLRLLELRKTVLGEKHRNSLQSMMGIATIRLQQGALDEAGQIIAEAFEIQRKVLGDKDGDTLRAMGILESVYSKQLEQQEETPGKEDPTTLRIRGRLAWIYLQRGNLEKARDYGVETVELQRRVLGLKSCETLRSMANLATTYLLLGQLAEAEEIGLQTVELRTQVLGPNSCETLQSMATMASIHLQQGQLEKAEEIGVRVLQLQRQILGAKHDDTLRTIPMLELLYRQQLKHQEQTLGEAHPSTFQTMAKLTSIYQQQNRPDKAEENETRLLLLRMKVLGTAHHDTVDSMKILEEMYYSRFMILQEAFRRSGDDSVRLDTLRSLVSVALIYYLQGWILETKMVVENEMTVLGGRELEVDKVMEILRRIKWGYEEGRESRAEKKKEELVEYIVK
ncbi:hypothetical protein ACJ41O_008725 [Fusarium nematophilum]